MLRYMDPDADGRCSLEEVAMALRRSHQNHKESANEATVSKIMEKLETEMHGEGGGHKMRVKDLFNKLDTDGIGYYIRALTCDQENARNLVEREGIRQRVPLIVLIVDNLG